MASITQARRSLSVASPLGPDVLLLVGFAGEESISRLFHYQLDLLSANESITAKDIVGQGVGWSVGSIDDEPRHFHGLVSRFSAGARGRRGLRSYRAEVVPWTWLLTRTADCRIYQNQTTPAIIEAVFNQFGLTDYSIELKGSYPAWEYCVQYRETAFNFVSRLMEREGIFYFFRHEEGKHTLVLADAVGIYADSPESPVRYSSGSLAPNHVSSWEHHYELRPGKWSRTDYNFQTPSTNLLTSTGSLIDLPVASKLELYDYPGEYPTKGEGDPVTKVRMEEEEAGFDVVAAESECCSFTPTGRFHLEEHDVAAENGQYAITSIRHSAAETSYGSGATGVEYSNSFTCIPASVLFRPARLTPKPVVQGVQTAVVVGPGGEEIYVDKFGRVKVQFFWDRVGKKDADSSCWIRVSEQWAGKNWGFVAHPRIGQEVVVDFLEGDPDRPLITGRVYNAEQMPPYDLPGNKTQSGLKSRSSKGGSPANYNEIRFEDLKGSELVTIHAEKDQSIEVEHDEAHWVGHDRTKAVDHDETTHVKHDRTETVDNNETITIGVNRTESVGVNESIAVGANRKRTVGGNESVSVVMTRDHTVGINEAITVGGAREVTVGGFQAISVGGYQAITVGGYQAFIVGANHSLRVGRNLTENVGGDRGETVVGKRTDNIGKDLQSSIGGSLIVSVKNDELVSVGKNFQMEAGEKIVLQTGDASITMNKNGTIVIKGKNISFKDAGKFHVEADGDIAMKGSKVTQN